MGGHQQFRLPDVGEGLTEAELLEWHVRPGDTVAVNQVICEIDTAKAAVELPCPFAGTVVALLVEEGEVVDVGTPIITVDVGEDSPAEEEPPSALVGYGRPHSAPVRPRAGAGDLPPRWDEAVGDRPSPPPREPRAVRSQSPHDTALAPPAVRLLARELGVDLDSVVGTGPHGSVTRDDVLRAAGGSDRRR